MKYLKKPGRAPNEKGKMGPAIYRVKDTEAGKAILKRREERARSAVTP